METALEKATKAEVALEKMNKPSNEQGKTSASNRSGSRSRLDRIEEAMVKSIELQQELNEWLEGDVKHRVELRKVQDARLGQIEERLANAEFQPKLDNEHQQRIDKIEETLTRIATIIEQREKLEDERQARVDEIARTVSASSEAITRIATIIEQREKLEDERQARVDKITDTVTTLSQTIAELKGMLTPWKIILGAIVSVSLATVLSVAGVKAVEALLKLVPG